MSMPLPTALKDYVEEARSTGRIANLPSQQHIAGKSIATAGKVSGS